MYKDKVYIADYSNKRVSVFQTNGQFYSIFGSDVLGRIEDVAVSADKYLIVAGYDPHCIYTFSLDGHYMGKFGTKGSGRCEFNDPYGIIGDSYGFIIVADTNNHRVSIFDKYRNCIHCFGSNGTAGIGVARPGQLPGHQLTLPYHQHSLLGIKMASNTSIIIKSTRNNIFNYSQGCQPLSSRNLEIVFAYMCFSKLLHYSYRRI